MREIFKLVTMLALAVGILLWTATAAVQTATAQETVGTSGSSTGPRIGLQGRLDAVNILAPGGVAAPGLNIDIRGLFVPIVTPGVRLIDDRLYLGLGFGFAGVSQDNRPADRDESRSAFSFSPLVSFDLLSDQVASFGLVGWLNLLSIGETEECEGGACRNLNDDGFGWGINLGVGVRGKISRGLAVGSEFGWGFLSIAFDNEQDVFYHGVFGIILFEATVGV